jgi:hypothetical protein
LGVPGVQLENTRELETSGTPVDRYGRNPIALHEVVTGTVLGPSCAAQCSMPRVFRFYDPALAQ